MKIHNYGSDYAYQQKQKTVGESSPAIVVVKPEPIKEINVTIPVKEDAGDKVQTGGEGDMAEVAKTPKQSSKNRKKETGAEKETEKEC